MEEVILMKGNYHTHTPRCGHAIGSDEENIQAAINFGLEELGFSEHAMFSDIYNEYGMRPPYNILEEYIQTLENLKEKYKDKITIYRAMECEYFEEYYEELKELLDSNKMDYLVFGNHFVHHKEGRIYTERSIWSSDEYFDLYVDTAIKAMNSKLFKIFAHPDLVFLFYPKWNEYVEKRCLEMIKAAKDNDVYMEVNIGGFRRGIQRLGNDLRYPYPLDKFWELVKKVQNKVIISFDSHNPKEISEDKHYKLALEFVKRLDLKVEEKINIK